MRDSLDADEIARLGSMWRRAKSELKGSKREVIRLKARILRDAAEDRSRREGEAEEAAALALTASSARGSRVADQLQLQDRVRFLELQLEESRQHNGKLRAQHREAITRLDESYRVVEERSAVSKRLAQDVEELEAKVQELQEQLTGVQEARESEREASAGQGHRLAEAQVEVARLREEREDAVEQVRRLEQGLVEAAGAAEEAGRRAEEAEHRSNQLGAVAAQEGMYRAQVAHLKRDNARLVRLLASTNEYRQFAMSKFGLQAAAAAAGGGSGGKLRSSYLGQVPRAGGTAADQYLGGGPMHRGDEDDEEEEGGEGRGFAALEGMQREYREELRESDLPARGGKEEASLWVPSEALRQMVSFRKRHLMHVPAEEVQGLLQGLNKVWHKRS